MPIPEVSLVMCVYNASRFLRPTIESILNQTFTDFEFLIVDDGSTDDSTEIIGSYSDRRVRLLKLPANRGVSAALNYGIEEACAPLLARTDADDVSEPTRLERQVEFLREHSGFALLGTWNTVIDTDGRIVGRSEYPTSHEEIREQLREQNCFCHSSVIMRTEVVRACGGYRAFRISQDYDLWTRIVQKHHVANLPECLVRYRVLLDSLSRASLPAGTTESAIVGHLYRERLAGRPDPLDELPFSEQPEWIRQHAYLVRAKAREKYRQGLAHLMHHTLANGNRRQALAFCLRAIRSVPRDPLFWRFLRFHGTPRSLQRLAYAVANPRRALLAARRRSRYRQ